MHKIYKRIWNTCEKYSYGYTNTRLGKNTLRALYILFQLFDYIHQSIKIWPFPSLKESAKILIQSVNHQTGLTDSTRITNDKLKHFWMFNFSVSEIQ